MISVKDNEVRIEGRGIEIITDFGRAAHGIYESFAEEFGKEVTKDMLVATVIAAIKYEEDKQKEEEGMS